jgi:hypothetical protein
VAPAPEPVEQLVAPAPAPANAKTLGVAYALTGSGLLPWSGSRPGFAKAYTALLQRQNVGVTTPNLTYVGSVGITSNANATRRLLQGGADNVTVYYDVGGVPSGDINSLPDTLNTTSTINTFRQLLVANGLTATSLRLVATKEGGIEISSETQSSGGGGLSGGAIGGIVAGVIVGILALLLLAYLCVYRARKESKREGSEGGVAPYYVTPATPVDGRSDGYHRSDSSPTVAATNGSTMMSFGSGPNGYDDSANYIYDHQQPGGYQQGYDNGAGTYPVKDFAHEGGQEFQHDPAAVAAVGAGHSSRWNPASSISNWWDRRGRSQGSGNNYDVQLGAPQDNFDPYAPNIGAAGSPRQ